MQKHNLSAGSLRWSMGIFCAFIGAFVLVAPHRFAGPSYAVLAPFRTWWGIAALASGVGLLSAATLRPRRAVALPVHAAAGLTLIALAVSFARQSGWMGLIFYGSLGVGLIAAGVLPRVGNAPRIRAERDLFSLLMGGAAVLSGIGLAVLPRVFATSGDAVRRLGPGLGLAMLATGAVLCWAALRTTSPRWLVWTAHLAAGAVFVLWGCLIALPVQAPTGVGLFIGGGAALALLPWLSQRLAHLDTSALRTRLALALALASSLSLILTAAVATSQEEHLAAGQVVEMRQVEAQAIARNVADYAALNAARASLLGVTAGRAPMTPEAQRFFLEQALPLYPGLTGLLSLDRAGRVLAAVGGVPLDAMDWRRAAAGVRRDLPVPVQLVTLRRGEGPHLVFCAPILGLDGGEVGVLVNVIDARNLHQRIARPDSNVYLADGHGRSIVRLEAADPGSAGPRWPDGWDREVAAGRFVSIGRHLAAFAEVPDLGWWVAVERPRRTALAGVREGRDLAFILLLSVVPVAVIGGIVAARKISRPLHMLADAADELTAGNPAAPLGTSSISEVARLSSAFAEMRDRLAARTRESERLAEELRARAEALADSDRRKDEFLAMLAHELRNPLGAIANSAWVLSEAGTAQPLIARAVAVIQRQIQNLVRLVDDLLDVSRITRGKVELRRERIELGDVVRHTIEAIRPLTEAKNQTLTVDLPAEALPLDADPTRLEQVLGNLLRNAAKFTDPGGRIGIAVRREDGQAVVSVHDNGVGIAPDLLPRIFDLFTQGQQGLDRTGAGLGIGLTLVRSLVEMHGGRVEAHSAGPGSGATMVVKLPLAAGPPAGSVLAPDLASPHDEALRR